MAQHDYVIDNQTAANVRSDLNNALAAIVSQNSSDTEPSTTFANMWWYDSANNILKFRNEANDGWINVGELDQSNSIFKVSGLIDEDDMSSDDATRAPTQQSVKAYVDSAGGAIKKVAYVQDGAVATGTTLIPYDDTIPQITEGDEYLSLAFTPTSATTVLMIEAVVHGAMSSGANFSAAIFEDGVNDALAVGNFTSGVTGGAAQTTVVRALISAASTSARTYKMRAGGAVAGTFTLNGTGSARRFGGKLISSLKVTEFAT